MMILFYFELYILSAAVFVFAAFTDMLDGKIARKNGLVTVLGKFVDPLADKLINLAAIIILTSRICQTQAAWYGVFATVTTVVIVARETIITSLRALAANEGVVIAADKLGKIKTVLQMVAVISALIIGKCLLTDVLIYASTFMAAYSGADYVIRNLSVFKK